MLLVPSHVAQAFIFWGKSVGENRMLSFKVEIGRRHVIQRMS